LHFYYQLVTLASRCVCLNAMFAVIYQWNSGLITDGNFGYLHTSPMWQYYSDQLAGR